MDMVVELPVIEAFDAISADYDAVQDDWYGALDARLEELILGTLGRNLEGRFILDIGCGTGLYSLKLARRGARVLGIDPARRLVEQARRKAQRWGLQGAGFGTGRAEALPVADRCADAVVCCGSVFAFVEEPEAALREFYRVLKPGGWLIFDLENRFGLDTVWLSLSGLLGDPLGYGVSRLEALRAVFTPPGRPVRLRYPLVRADGSTVYVGLRLDPPGLVKRWVCLAGFRVEAIEGLHIAGALIPSTLTIRPAPPRLVRSAFRGLVRLDRVLARLRPLKHLGTTLVFICRKPATARPAVRTSWAALLPAAAD